MRYRYTGMENMPYLSHMYTKEQASKIRQRFWTTFGQYMKPVPGASGMHVNWLNYKTGVRSVFFRMDAGKQEATISVDIRNADPQQRESYYRQFVSLQQLLTAETGFSWEFEATVLQENSAPYSRIYQQLAGVNIMNEKDWPAIIGFLKPRIIALDHFWELVKDGFE